MANTEENTAVKEILNHSRIIKNNPFSVAIEGVVAEWMQLLLVVEKIKQHKSALPKLRNIEAIAQAVLSNAEIDSQTQSHPLINARMRSDGHYNPSIDQHAVNKWQQLDLLLKTLDAGQKYETFLSQAVQASQSKGPSRGGRRVTQDTNRNIQLDVIPELCSNVAFDWPNLNELRLHYPHHLILRALMYGDKLLDAIETLIAFGDEQFSDIRTKAVVEFLNSMERGRTPFPSTLNAQEAINFRHDIVNAFNDAIFQESIAKVTKLVHSIPASIHLDCYDDRESTLYLLEIDITTDNQQLHIQFPERYLIEALNRNNDEQLFDLLIDKMYAKVKKHQDLDQAAKERLLAPDNTQQQQYQAPLPKTVINALWDYQHWSSALNYALFRKASGIKLARNAAVRGVRFSIWFETFTRNQKSNIKTGTEKYCEENGERYGTALTVKQSYEAIKRFSSHHLPGFVFNQVRERAYSDSNLNKALLAPLNICLDEHINAFEKQLHKELPWVIEDETELPQLVLIYKKLHSLYQQFKDCIAIDATDAYLHIKGEPLPKSDNSLWSNRYNPINPIKLATLQHLLRYDIDIFD